MDKLFIIKIGGNIVDNNALLHHFLQQFAAIPQKKILVHGGGKLATRVAESMNIPQQMVDGRRITDAETLKVVTMVYAGYINKNIVAQLQALHCNAVGICGADANIITAHKRTNVETDYGYVGDIDAINTHQLQSFFLSNLSPVVAPLTHDKTGQLLNTNADTIAQELAKALSSEYQTELIYCFEKPGVLLDVENPETLIASLNYKSYQKLKNSQQIFAGMLPKLENAFSAISAGIHSVIIGNGTALTQLTTGKAGTRIIYE
jgi:acetylglutamate kinase